MRNSPCYPLDGTKWMATTRRVGQRSLIVTIPADIVERLALRPGCKVIVEIEKYDLQRMELHERF